jgi:uncharacterized membrane protein
MMTLKSKITLAFIFIFFFVIYASISFANHYNFRTYLDLGMINHALYSFAHLKWDYFTLDINGNMINYFGDHFSPITFLYIPFYFVFGSYAPLMVQILAVLFGGLGIYYYAQEKKIVGISSSLFLLHFLGIWGIYSALSFDFHNNVVGCMFLPWMLLKREQGKVKEMLFYFLLMLISRENMALWLGFIFLGLLLQNKLEKNVAKTWKVDVVLILISFIYFLIIVGFVMPFLSGSEKSMQIIRYAHLGNSVSEILGNIIKDPRYTFSLLFENRHDESFFSGIKSEFHFMVLVSGGFLFFSRPYYLVMLLPIYAQKMLTRDAGLWGINAQYSIEFVPILSIAVVDFCAQLHDVKGRKIALAMVLLLTYYFTIATMDNRKSTWYDSVKTRFYQKSHYQTEINVTEVQKVLKTIPEEAVVSCMSMLSPHLAFRDKIYHFPVVNDANYIVLLSPKYGAYPLSREQFEDKIRELKQSSTFSLIYDQHELLVFRKN